MQTKAVDTNSGMLARGIALTILLGPLTLAAGLLAAVSLIGAITGWGPEFLKTDSPLDFLYGGGSATMLRYFTFMVGAVIASAGYGAIRWGFTGRFEFAGTD